MDKEAFMLGWKEAIKTVETLATNPKANPPAEVIAWWKTVKVTLAIAGLAHPALFDEMKTLFGKVDEMKALCSEEPKK